MNQPNTAMIFLLLSLQLVSCSGTTGNDGDELSRLERLFHKIDTNADERVSQEELNTWMTAIKRRLNNADTVTQFKSNDVNGDGEVTWEEHTAVFWKDNKRNDHNKHLLSDHQRRFNLADVENNGQLTSQQFAAFLHPEDDERMIEHMVNQTIAHLDANADGVVSLNEYTADLWAGEGKKPNWLITEEKKFGESHDQNKDGVMDQSEVRDWIFPREKGIKDQVEFLMKESDADIDGMLSLEEMMLNFALFLGNAELKDEQKKTSGHDEL